MRIAVIGGGVVGVTSAYQVGQDGHEVVLIERAGDVATGASAGNAGMIAPGHCFVWSSPEAPRILLRSLYRGDQALRLRPSASPELWRWSLGFLLQCTERKARRNTLRKHVLATYSQQVLREVVAAEGLIYDRNEGGILYVHRDSAALARGIARMTLLATNGQEVQVLDRDGVVALEPALAASGASIAGGIWCPTDETGDSRKFVKQLAQLCVDRGAEIRLDTTVTGVEIRGDRITAVVTNRGRIAADCFVLATGVQSARLGAAFGLRLPIYPIKGYSLTVPVGNHTAPPTRGVVDEANLVAISRMGDRIRVTATAEFAGYDTGHTPKDFGFMRNVVQELYPDGADYAQPTMWAGLRPMTADNMPVIGRRRYANLYVNTGHGHIGWTMSHGSARIAADLIAGRPPAIDLDRRAAA